MSAKNAKITLKILQNEMYEKINILKEELTDLKKELEDVKEELKICKNGSVNNFDQKDMSEKVLNCNECEESFKAKIDLKKHLKACHVRYVKCKICEESFDKNCHLEEHIRENHEATKMYECDKCEKTFLLKWRMKKHREGHDMLLKKCHYFNNNKICPFEQIGCMFDHSRSGPCKYGTKCKIALCAFKHESSDNFTEEESRETLEEVVESESDKELLDKFEEYDGMEKFEAGKVICDFFCNNKFGFHRYCEEDFETFAGLDALNIHDEVDTDGKNKKYLPCEKCDDEFEEYKNLRKHFLTKHTKDKFVECIVENCEFEAKNIDQLTMHICVDHYFLVREKIC